MGRQSRGELPLKALALPRSQLQTDLNAEPGRYAGFNLVSLSGTGGWYYSNRDAHPGRQVFRGVYGLSNHLLQTPWPKLLRLRTAVGHCVERAGADVDRLHQQLILLLKDSNPAPDHELPDTGVGIDTERFLSSPFIHGEHYGTRATTVVTVSRDGEIRVTEQSWAPFSSPLEQRQFSWQRQPGDSGIIRTISDTPDRRAPWPAKAPTAHPLPTSRNPWKSWKNWFATWSKASCLWNSRWPPSSGA